MTAEFRIAHDWSNEAIWLTDRNKRIARIAPPRLMDVCLVPEQEPQIKWLMLVWWQYPYHETGNRAVWLLDELCLDDRDPQRFTLSMRTHNADRSVESQSQVAVTYDSQSNSYLYSVSTALCVADGRQWLVEPQDGIEYANPWLMDVAGRAGTSAANDELRWPWVLYRNETGDIVRLALNHLGGPHHMQIGFDANDAWLGFFNHSGGNPVIALDSATARATRAEICAWGYDVHFLHRLNTSETFVADLTRIDAPVHREILLGERQFEARYRVFSAGEVEGGALLAASVLPALPEEVVTQLKRPAYHAENNSFCAGLVPNVPDAGWYWEPSTADGTIWDHSTGHGDCYSLRIVNLRDRRVFWEAAVGADFWQEPLPHHSPLRLSGWLRTEKVVGVGAYLSFQFSSYRQRTGQAPELPEHHSTCVTGDQGWTYVEINIPPCFDEEITRGYIRLYLDGSGQAWFDDIELRPLTDECA